MEVAAGAHPRLFMDAAKAARVKRKIKASPQLSRAFAHVEACAKAIVIAKPLVRKKTGRRLLSISRACLKRVTHLAFAYRMTGKAQYLKRAEAEMLAAAGFTDWNPSHFLDVAEMTAALAIGYDWLYADLSPDARATIRTAIVNKGLKTSLKGGWWVKTTNNWNQVCHGGLSLGAFAVMEDEPELATKIITRAVKNLPHAMHEYAPDGAYPEGPGYWKYGTTYNVLLLDALQSVLDTDFDLAASKGFLASADYYQQMTGPKGLFFNYSDCGTKGGVAPAMYWFASKRRDASLLMRERKALTEYLGKTKPSASGGNRLLPFLLLWASEGDGGDAPTTLHWHATGTTPVAVHRSAWTEDAVFAGIKGGTPAANHAHMDIGSFVMDADGVRWASDLGAQSYHSLESKGISLWGKKQDSQRWTVFRLNSLAHNTLVIDGQHQRVKGVAPITSFVDHGPRPCSVIDMSTVYAGQLRSSKRGLALQSDRSVIVQDELICMDRETEVRWAMMTRAKVKSLRGATAELERKGQRLTLRVISPAGVEVRTYETAKPRAAHDHSNPGTRMIGFELTFPPLSEQRIVVQLIPGSSKARDTKVTPLCDW